MAVAAVEEVPPLIPTSKRALLKSASVSGHRLALLAEAYTTALKEHPILTNSLTGAATGGVCCIAGDLLSQLAPFLDGANGAAPLDLYRTFHMFIYGLMEGALRCWADPA